jgi:hypothetical protein
MRAVAFCGAAVVLLAGCNPRAEPNTGPAIQQPSQPSQPASNVSTAPKTLDQMLVKYTPTDLTKHGFPLMIDLPNDWPLRIDEPGFDISFPISRDFRLQLNLIVPAALVLPLTEDKSFHRHAAAEMLAETDDGFYYRREHDLDGHPAVYIRRDVQAGGKQFSLTTEMMGVPRTRDYTDTIWAVARSLRPVNQK